jgi:hypothetical protein
VVSHPSQNARRTPNFLQVDEARSACAPFFKERRMKTREPTKPHRKSGGWGTRAVAERIRLKADSFIHPRVGSASERLKRTRHRGLKSRSEKQNLGTDLKANTALSGCPHQRPLLPNRLKSRVGQGKHSKNFVFVPCTLVRAPEECGVGLERSSRSYACFGEIEIAAKSKGSIFCR